MEEKKKIDASETVACIKIRMNEQDYYIPADRIESVTAEPEVVKVPGAQESIAGITLYKNRVVPYIYAGDGKRKGAEQTAACGMIVKMNDGTLAGFCVESVSERIYVPGSEIKELVTDKIQQLRRAKKQ